MSKFSILNNVIEVPEPLPNSENWYVSNTQTVSISKDQFFLTSWRSDFPTIKVEKFDEISALVSRSKALQDWYAKKNVEYIRRIEVPGYLDKVLPPDDFNKIKQDLKEVNAAFSEEGAAIKEASDEFKRKLEAIRLKTKERLGKVYQNKIVRVVTMNASELPLSLLVKIEGYTPKTDDPTQSRERYAQEVLYNYQRSLVQLLQSKPDVDIEAVISGLELK